MTPCSRLPLGLAKAGFAEHGARVRPQRRTNVAVNRRRRRKAHRVGNLRLGLAGRVGHEDEGATRHRLGVLDRFVRREHRLDAGVYGSETGHPVGQRASGNRSGDCLFDRLGRALGQDGRRLARSGRSMTAQKARQNLGSSAPTER